MSAEPIFEAVSRHLCEGILRGTYPAHSQIPSKNELSVFFQINPATAANGVTALADAGILYKKRGIGMFVAQDARERLLEQRRSRFIENFVEPILAEAALIHISRDDLINTITNHGVNHESQH